MQNHDVAQIIKEKYKNNQPLTRVISRLWLCRLAILVISHSMVHARVRAVMHSLTLLHYRRTLSLHALSHGITMTCFSQFFNDYSISFIFSMNYFTSIVNNTKVVDIDSYPRSI